MNAIKSTFSVKALQFILRLLVKSFSVSEKIHTYIFEKKII